MNNAATVDLDGFTGSVERQELLDAFRRNTLRGLLVASALHFGAIGVYFLQDYLARADDAPTVRVRIMKYSELGPPPSLTSAQAPAIAVSGPTVKPSIGIPVPVPDAEISPEQTIATQQELQRMQSPLVEGFGDNGENVDIQIDEPGIDEFVPVEKLPMPIKQVTPTYPEIARRSGVEGTVWVKILVDKSGNAKRAVVVRSDSEIFNEVAVEAALQWKFTPALMNKGPVAVWVVVPFRFKLAGGPS